MMKKGMSILIISFMLMGAFGVLITVSENAQAAGLANTSWPMFHGNARHTGLSPYDTSSNNGGYTTSLFIAVVGI